MKTSSGIIGLLVAVCLSHPTWAQSTTGGRSGGSTASTGTGYLTQGKRPAETSAASMTIADEGASRAYMYVPPTPGTKTKNRSASPDGSDSSTADVPTSQTPVIPHPAARKQSGPKPPGH